MAQITIAIWPDAFALLPLCPSYIRPLSLHPTLLSTSVAPLPNVDNQENYNWGPVLVEEEFPFVPPQSPLEPTLISLRDIKHFSSSSFQVEGSLPNQPLNEQWSFPVLEEMSPMVIEEISPVATGMNTDPTQIGPETTTLAPTHNFSKEHLQLIFDLRRDVVDQLFH
jgi:hypothetical protein